MSIIWNDRVARFHAVWFTSALWSRASASTLSPSRLKWHLNFAEPYCLLQNDKCTLMFVFLSLTRSWQSFKCAFLFSGGQTLMLEESDSAEKMQTWVWRKINNTVKENYRAVAKSKKVLLEKSNSILKWILSSHTRQDKRGYWIWKWNSHFSSIDAAIEHQLWLPALTKYWHANLFAGILKGP